MWMSNRRARKSLRSIGDDSALIKSFKFFDVDDYEILDEKIIKNEFEMIDYDM